MDKNDVQESSPQQNSQNRVGIGMHVLIPRPVAAPAPGRGGMLMLGPPDRLLPR